MSPPKLIECVPNISEGRDLCRVDLIAEALSSVSGVILLHRTSDPDHNRSVLTFAGRSDRVLDAAINVVAKAAELIDLTGHTGVHPRVGALDVLPFVPIGDTSLADCVDIAHEAGERIWQELGIPVYFYEAAAKRAERAKLENVRRGGFELLREIAPSDPSKAPDVGGPAFHPKAGAVIVGARNFLIAFNINLRSKDLSLAKTIAKQIRASSGGMPGVKALGLPLLSRNMVQVSVNITDYQAAPLHEVYLRVKSLAEEAGVQIKETELIGLAPRHAIEVAAAGLLNMNEFDSSRVIENQIDKLILRV